MGASAVEMSKGFPASLTGRARAQEGEGARIRIEGREARGTFVLSIQS